MNRQGSHLGRWWIHWLLALCLYCSLPPSYAVVVTDDAGQRVEMQAPVRRVVSLLPSLTETVCALDACDRLVAVDTYSNYPASVRSLPKVGGGLNPNVEAVLRLKPDVVLMATSSPARQRFRELGLTVVSLEPKDEGDLRRATLVLGTLLAAGSAPALLQRMERDMQGVIDGVPAAARGRTVYFEVNRAPYAAGEASFIGQTLARLGLRNIIPADMGAFPKINPEFVVRAQPEMVMVGDSDPAALGERPGWGQLRALQAKRLCVFNPQQSDALVRPGPRMAEGARVIADCLRRLYP